MAADDHLNGQQFYHGTSGAHTFKPGGLLSPEGAPDNVLGARSGRVYYTSSLETAKGYATWHSPRLDDDPVPGHVYRVQPETSSGRTIVKHAADKDNGLPGNKDAYQTKGRLRVLHEVDRKTGEPL